MAVALPSMVKAIDHAGPFMGKNFLVVMDAHSKWIDVSTVPSTSSDNTISRLHALFSTHGLPVSDNTASFTSEEFVQANGNLFSIPPFF